MKPSPFGRWMQAAARPALLAWLVLTAAAARPVPAEELIRDLQFPGLEVERDASGTASLLSLPGARIDVPFGEPMVPSLDLVLELPEGRRASGARLQLIAQEWVELSLPVGTYAGEEAIDIVPVDPPAHPPVPYAEDEHFPPRWVDLVSTVELTDGSRHAVLRLHPLRLWPAARRLLWVTDARLIVELEEGAADASGPARKRPPLASGAPATAGRLLLAEPGLAFREAPSIEGSPVEYAIISPSSPQMVAAWKELADWKTATGHPAQVFPVDWIEQHYPSGADRAERIRLFLQDAYAHWGLRWALLGGDVEDIPVRYALSMAYGGTSGTLIATDYYYACLEGNWDADGDGIFGEGDDRAVHGGQRMDWVDTTPEIHVGRVSARTPAEVRDYLDKYFVHERTPPADGYLDRYLLLGEVLFHAQWSLTGLGSRSDCHAEECMEDYCRRIDNQRVCATMDGSSDCFMIEAILADSLSLPLERTLLLERAAYWAERKPELQPPPIVETGAEVIAQINAGHGFVHHIGHGDRDRWAVGAGRLLIADLAALTNGAAGHFFWAQASNCYSAAVDYDCIGERMVLMPGHGAVGYMGCSNAEFPGTATKFVRDFYRFGFGADGRTIGDGFYGAQGAHALTGAFANSEFGYTRFLLYSQILIGEPGMILWRGTPADLDVELVGHPQWTVPLGSGPLTVAVTGGGSPVAGARVCVHKLDEVYAVGVTDATGRIALPFAPRTLGYFSVGASAPGFRPVLVDGDGAEVVGPMAGAVLRVEGLTVVDDGSSGSDGDGNGAIEAGEEIVLSLSLANLGSAAAAGVSAKLRPGRDIPAGTLALIDSTASFAAVPAGGAPVTVADAFRLSFAARPPAQTFGEADSRRLSMRVVVTHGAAEFETPLSLELRRPRLAVSPNVLVDPAGPAADLWLGLENLGKGSASRLTARLTSLQPGSITVEGGASAAMAVRDIAPDSTALAGPFRLSVSNPLGRLRLEVTTSLGGTDTLHTRELDLSGPAAPEPLALIGLPQAIRASWEEPSDPGGDGILGYRVYRAPAGSGEFVEAFPGLLVGHRFFEESGLAELARYTYYVTAVDSGGNLGAASGQVSAYTSPGVSAGWPNQVEVATEASPMICELDGWAGPAWGREVVFGAETLYAFHSDGSEVIDGDFLERTRGPFTAPGYGHVGQGFWGRAACGDLDGDGEKEIVAVAFNRTNEASLPDARGEIVCWGPWGRAPKWVFTMPRCVAWTTPVLCDLDEDGTLETIFLAGPSGQAGVYILDHNGRPWGDTDPATGLLRSLGGHNLYQRPAVGDVDGDGQPDIVVATRTSDPALGALHVLRPNGNYVVGFSGQGSGLLFSAVPTFPLANQSTTGSATLCNVDGVPGDEIFVVTPDRLWCFKRNGLVLWKLDFTSRFTPTYQVFPEPALGDVNRDNLIDVALVDASAKLHLLRGSSGQAIPPFPIQLETGVYYGSCILVNVDEGPEPEIVFGDNKQRIHAYTFRGEIARGFPIHFGGKLMHQSLAAWDIDEDGFQNLVVQANQSTRLSVYDLSSSPFPQDPVEQAKQNPWPMRSRDPHNSGRYTNEPPVAVRLQAEAPVLAEDGGVFLAWSTAEAVQLFRIRRSASAEDEALLVGEVPGRAGGASERYTFTDRPPAAGRYVYRINPVSLAGEEEPGPLVAVLVGPPAAARFGIQRVSPDPLTRGREATIAFGLPDAGTGSREVRLEVFDLQGRRVAALVQGERAPGTHFVVWDGRDDGGRPVTTGLYLLRLQAGGQAGARRLLVVR